MHVGCTASSPARTPFPASCTCVSTSLLGRGHCVGRQCTLATSCRLLSVAVSSHCQLGHHWFPPPPSHSSVLVGAGTSVLYFHHTLDRGIGSVTYAASVVSDGA